MGRAAEITVISTPSVLCPRLSILMQFARTDTHRAASKGLFDKFKHYSQQSSAESFYEHVVVQVSTRAHEIRLELTECWTFFAEYLLFFGVRTVIRKQQVYRNIPS